MNDSSTRFKQTRPHTLRPRVAVRSNALARRTAQRSLQRGAIRFPWWMWLALGGILYFGVRTIEPWFHASDGVRTTLDVALDVGAIAALVACTVIAAVTFMLGRNTGANLPAQNAPAQRPKDAPPGETRMSWGQFELLAVEAFRRRGFQITERGSSSDDGSRNLQLTRGRQRFIAHCKAWRQSVVDIGAVRELYSIVIVTKADGGIVITTGTFSQEARTFAAGRQLQLIDGPTLRELLRDAEGQPTVMPTIIPTDIVESPNAHPNR